MSSSRCPSHTATCHPSSCTPDRSSPGAGREQLAGGRHRARRTERTTACTADRLGQPGKVDTGAPGLRRWPRPMSRVHTRMTMRHRRVPSSGRVTAPVASHRRRRSARQPDGLRGLGTNPSCRRRARTSARQCSHAARWNCRARHSWPTHTPRFRGSLPDWSTPNPLCQASCSRARLVDSISADRLPPRCRWCTAQPVSC